jgi:hypothetical protein
MAETHLRPLWRDLPQLSLEERDRRWHAVRERMAEQSIDALVIVKSGLRGEHVRYLTQLLLHNSGAVIFPLKGEPTVFTDALHIGKYAQACSTWVKDVREDFEHLPDQLMAMGLEHGTVGLVGGLRAHTRLRRESAPAGYPIVKATLPSARIVDATQMFEELETIKAPAEIEFLYRAAEIAHDVYGPSAMLPGLAPPRPRYTRRCSMPKRPPVGTWTRYTWRSAPRRCSTVVLAPSRRARFSLATSSSRSTTPATRAT